MVHTFGKVSPAFYAILVSGFYMAFVSNQILECIGTKSPKWPS